LFELNVPTTMPKEQEQQNHSETPVPETPVYDIDSLIQRVKTPQTIEKSTRNGVFGFLDRWRVKRKQEKERRIQMVSDYSEIVEAVLFDKKIREAIDALVDAIPWPYKIWTVGELECMSAKFARLHTESHSYGRYDHIDKFFTLRVLYLDKDTKVTHSVGSVKISIETFDASKQTRPVIVSFCVSVPLILYNKRIDEITTITCDDSEDKEYAIDKLRDDMTRLLHKVADTLIV